MITEFFFSDRDQLFAELYRDCFTHLQHAVDTRGGASLLVSGGGTPKPLYQQLAAAKLPWEKIQVALVDERWVEPQQAGSNQAFIEQSLLQADAARAQFIPAINQHATAAAGLPECEQAYAQLSRPFDFTLLGMGADGHTASLFPRSQGLETAIDLASGQLCAAITASPSEVTGDYTERMTLSLYGLCQSRQLHLLITGEEKLRVYHAAREVAAGENPDLLSLPVAAVLQQTQVPVWVYWAP